MNRLESSFEWILWNSRLVVLVAVLASLATTFAMFYVASVDAFELVGNVLHYAQAGHTAGARIESRTVIITHVVEVVDGYLLGAIMLIFALGLYELFISRIDIAEKSEFASRLLLIRSLDDLKDRLAKVVLLILVVKFFEYALATHISTPLDLLYLATGILFVAIALYFSHGKSHSGKDKEKTPSHS